MEALFIIISWVLAFVCWLPVGAFALVKFGNPLSDRPVHRLIISLMLGAAISSAVMAACTFFVNLDVLSTMVLLLFWVLLFGKKGWLIFREAVLSTLTWPSLYSIAALAFFAIALLVSVQPSLNNDSGLYYIQFVKWINQYPVIPGLANLHDRLGFNSHWHLITAAFNLYPLVKFSGNDMNGFLFFLIGLGSLESASRLVRQPSTYDLTWAIFPLPFFLLMRFLTSDAPDLPSTLIPLIYFTFLIDGKKQTSLPIVITLILFAATIKVLSILHLIAILPLCYWTLVRKEWNSVISSSILALVVLVPWLGRNLVQTGYLIFPMESLDLFSFDWKVPHELAANARKIIDTHARMGSYDLANYDKPTLEWIKFWFGVQSKSVLALLSFVFSGSFLLVLADLLKIDRHRSSEHTIVNLFLALTVLSSFAFWWLSGPNPRFIYGVVFFFFAYSLAVISMNFNLGKWLRFSPLFSLLPILMLTRTVMTEQAPKKPTAFSSFEVMDEAVFYPTETDKCWEHELPCTNMARTDLELRGDNLNDGLRNLNSVH